MRARLNAALFLLLSSFFLVGGSPATAAYTALSHPALSHPALPEISASAPQHGHSREVLPTPQPSRAHADVGGQSGFGGGFAVLPAAVQPHPLTYLASAKIARQDVPPGASRATVSARAPPASTGL